jgi:hypothetical protein
MKVISLGMGVQSTAMYMMSSKNIIERADHAVFADPGAESPETYEIVELLIKWQKENNGIPIHIVDEYNLLQDLLKSKNSTGQRFSGIPAFSNYTGGMLRRQCTAEYKIKPVMKKIRDLHGLKKYQRMPKTQVWLGISMDEIQRMKISQLPNVEYYYPLIEERLSRYDCLKLFDDFDFPKPPKSACVFCPYYSDKGWKQIKDNDKKTWKVINDVDKSIRNSLIERGLKGELFLHRSTTPLDKVQFADQQELFMCEEGFCGL